MLARGRLGIAGPDATVDERGSSDRMNDSTHSGAVIE
jgi:hypothetical protein